MMDFRHHNISPLHLTPPDTVRSQSTSSNGTTESSDSTLVSPDRTESERLSGSEIAGAAKSLVSLSVTPVTPIREDTNSPLPACLEPPPKPRLKPLEPGIQFGDPGLPSPRMVEGSTSGAQRPSSDTEDAAMGLVALSQSSHHVREDKSDEDGCYPLHRCDNANRRRHAALARQEQSRVSTHDPPLQATEGAMLPSNRESEELGDMVHPSPPSESNDGVQAFLGRYNTMDDDDPEAVALTTQLDRASTRHDESSAGDLFVGGLLEWLRARDLTMAYGKQRFVGHHLGEYLRGAKEGIKFKDPRYDEVWALDVDREITRLERALEDWQIDAAQWPQPVDVARQIFAVAFDRIVEQHAARLGWSANNGVQVRLELRAIHREMEALSREELQGLGVVVTAGRPITYSV